MLHAQTVLEVILVTLDILVTARMEFHQNCANFFVELFILSLCDWLVSFLSPLMANTMVSGTEIKYPVGRRQRTLIAGPCLVLHFHQNCQRKIDLATVLFLNSSFIEFSMK